MAEVEDNEAETIGFDEFVKEVEQSVLKMIAETSKAPETIKEQWQAFASAVDWSEAWIQGLLAAELALFLVVLLTRKMFYTQCCIFLLICGLVFASETLNTHLGARWGEFARQNYFDEHGVFMATLYAGPLLCIAFVQLVNFIILMSDSLIQAKKAQLRRKRKQSERTSGAGGVVGNGNAAGTAANGSAEASDETTPATTTETSSDNNNREPSGSSGGPPRKVLRQRSRRA